MELDGLELPEPCMPASPWQRESWAAAGVRIDVPDASAEAEAGLATRPGPLAR